MKLNLSYFISFIFLGLITSSSSFAQSLMEGRVYQFDTDEALADVVIMNVTQNEMYYSDENGYFHIEVAPEDLIEFRKMGFQIARVTIRKGPLPYFHINLEPGSFELPIVFIKGYSYKADSIRSAEIYKNMINYHKKEDINILANPFALLDPRSRQIWRFQKMYQQFESEKFIDYVFNEALVLKITPNFDQDYMQEYLKNYRPLYDQIKKWTAYEYLFYVKTTSQKYIKNHVK